MHASDPFYAQCRIGDGWLRYAKERRNWKGGWDAGAKTHVAPSDDRFAVDPLNDALYLHAPWSELDLAQRTAVGNRELRTRGQFMHGIYREGGPIITGPNDPFWNARAIDNAQQAHSGIFSPMTWCALHQLVLDDPAGSPLYSKKNLWKPRTLPVDEIEEGAKNGDSGAARNPPRDDRAGGP
jgi:hypothetical protein